MSKEIYRQSQDLDEGKYKCYSYLPFALGLLSPPADALHTFFGMASKMAGEVVDAIGL